MRRRRLRLGELPTRPGRSRHDAASGGSAQRLDDHQNAPESLRVADMVSVRGRAASSRERAAFAAFILDRHEDIALHWVGAIDRHQQIKATDDLTFRQLLDHFPELCRELAHVLQTPAAESPRAEASEHSAAHGRKRWQQGFRLDELIREICIVRRDFLGRWLPSFEQANGAIEPVAREAIKEIVHEFFDDMLIDSTGQFVDEQHQARSEMEAKLHEHELRLAAHGDARSRFLSLVSHELRTPLVPVLLEMKTLLRDAALPATLRDSLVGMNHKIETEVLLIDDLLDATRFADGSIDLRFANLDVHELISSAIGSCRLDFDESQVELRVELNASETMSRGDACRLRRAFTAILRNAANVSPPHGVVTVSSRNTETGHQIEIAVQDSGDRIDPRMAERIFSPFEEGRRTIFGVGGMGLGRYVAKAVVGAHGGKITVAPATADLGAVYTITLPLQD
jgi:signal transduction histidine kinase